MEQCVDIKALQNYFEIMQNTDFLEKKNILIGTENI